MCIPILVLLFLSLSIAAQTPPPKPDNDILKIDTRLINLNVKVLDPGGKAVSNLTQADFEVREDGDVQEIAHFQPVTAPVSLVLLLDLSGSTEKKRKLMTKAAQRFLDSLVPEDNVAVAAFTDQFFLLHDFTKDRKKLKKAVEKIKDIKGATAYYDAMWASLDHLASLKDARKAIVVLTDGVDNTILRRPPPRLFTDPNSPLANVQIRINGKLAGLPKRSVHTFDELLARASAEEVAIYPLRLNTRAEIPTRALPTGNSVGDQIRRNVLTDINQRAEQQYAIADSQLNSVAAQTNGEVFPVDREEDLEGVFQRVAAELHLFYTLAYYPRNAQADGKFRKVAVQVKQPGAKAKTR
ncbi:MAG TPA: VWA domain-containing protein, partial [Blastocatellia bacterium]|nr:VWA domain-containing protein [Blastocatellia bacterium]